MELSIIVPVFNEINYIDNLLTSLISVDVASKEILLVDGASNDGTSDKLKEWSVKYPIIKIIDNPQRYTSHGFNKAYSASTGKYIAFIGAHAIYPINYFSMAARILDADETDVVGGPLHQAGKTSLGKAIAYCMSTKFGVGDTEFRTSKERRFVQSVAFAVYKRTVFEKVGLMDEQLIRNQDDEFHYRLNQHGYRILMVPEMGCTYYVRESLKSLAKQYLQYGLYKPLVLKKVRSGIKLRHLVPAFFVLYILLLPALYNLLGLFSLSLLMIYLCALGYFSFINTLSVKQKFYCCAIYTLLHITYGAGFIAGLVKTLK